MWRQTRRPCDRCHRIGGVPDGRRYCTRCEPIIRHAMARSGYLAGRTSVPEGDGYDADLDLAATHLMERADCQTET